MLRVFHGAALVAKQLAILQAEAAPRAGRLPKAPVRWERAADEPLKHEWEARQAAGKTGGSSGNGSGKVNEASEGVATSKAAASSVSSSSGTFVDASPIVQSKEQPAAAAPDQAKDGRSWLPLRTDGGGPSAGNAASSHAEPLGAPTASARAQGSTVDVGGPSGAGSSAGTSDSSRPQRSVPSNAITRAVHFGGLGISLAAGAASAAIRRAVAGPSEGEGSSVLATDANVERLAETLCRLRGAALKVGQMLSFNDADVLPPAMRVAMERVRDGADWMPQRQLEATLREELGDEWRQQLHSFEVVPVAAASIGQVHRAVFHDGRQIAIKVQYPGVADSIRSDLWSMRQLIFYTGLVPPGLFLDRVRLHAPQAAATLTRQPMAALPVALSSTEDLPATARQAPPRYSLDPRSTPSSPFPHPPRSRSSSLHGGRFAGPRGGSQGAAPGVRL